MEDGLYILLTKKMEPLESGMPNVGVRVKLWECDEKGQAVCDLSLPFPDSQHQAVPSPIYFKIGHELVPQL